MHTAAELLRAKDYRVLFIHPTSSVLDAAQKMNDQRVGALIVIDQGQLVGIITERDVMTRVVAQQKPPGSTFVASIMTKDVFTCSPSTHLCDVRRAMQERRIRHVPVVDAGRVVGMVSIGDLNAADLEVLTRTVTQLEAYICG